MFKTKLNFNRYLNIAYKVIFFILFLAGITWLPIWLFRKSYHIVHAQYPPKDILNLFIAWLLGMSMIIIFTMISNAMQAFLKILPSVFKNIQQTIIDKFTR